MRTDNFFLPLALTSRKEDEEERRELQKILLALMFSVPRPIPPSLRTDAQLLCAVWTPETQRLVKEAIRERRHGRQLSLTS